MDPRKETLLASLRAFARQRPGLEPANYGDASAYRAESRAITRDLHDVETLLAAVAWRDSITADRLVDAARGAYSGRLAVAEPTPGKFEVIYHTGQYFPTEYRRAVCAVLASALWDYARECMPEPKGDRDLYDGLRAGDWLRRYFRREFGARMQRRWFD